MRLIHKTEPISQDILTIALQKIGDTTITVSNSCYRMAKTCTKGLIKIVQIIYIEIA